MRKRSQSNQMVQNRKDSVQPANQSEIDVMTMGDMSLEKAERLDEKNQMRSETNGASS
ncbi:hypothetical protein [Halalkalibacter okhensis]|uniref:hypothetical protein n=1 Tax=Halalkalibacter okhensis TaxID=333138 RepID=UPI000A3F880F|nr:hypothetical protein [Halalkalibacter okhensis]